MPRPCCQVWCTGFVQQLSSRTIHRLTLGLAHLRNIIGGETHGLHGHPHGRIHWLLQNHLWHGCAQGYVSLVEGWLVHLPDGIGCVCGRHGSELSIGLLDSRINGPEAIPHLHNITEQHEHGNDTASYNWNDPADLVYVSPFIIVLVIAIMVWVAFLLLQSWVGPRAAVFGGWVGGGGRSSWRSLCLPRAQSEYGHRQVKTNRRQNDKRNTEGSNKKLDKRERAATSWRRCSHAKAA